MQKVQETTEQFEEAYGGPALVQRLEEEGINNGDIKKFTEAGFHSIQSILYTAKKNLIKIKGITEGKLDKVLTACKLIISHISRNRSPYCPHGIPVSNRFLRT